jgi:MFS family permease
MQSQFMRRQLMHVHRIAPMASITASTRQAPDHDWTIEEDHGWGTATWALLVVVCGALFLDALDLSMVGVALPSIGTHLHLQAGSLQWVVSGYVLGYGSFLLLGGRASDIFSRRTVFLVAVGVFGIASVVSAFVNSEAALVALRFIKGASAGFTVPAGLSILTTTFAEGPARNRALGVYTLCGASGFSLGLVFGGLLTELGWRATFFVPGPIALVLVAFASRVVPRVRSQRVRVADLDLGGAFTATASLFLLVYAVVEAPRRGWASVETLGFIVASVALMASFVAIELRHRRPLVRLGILRSGALLHANLCAAAMYGSYAAFQFLVTIYLQDSLRWSPLAMALALLPGGAIVVLSAPRTGQLLRRFPTSVVLLMGFSAFVAGYALFLRVRPGMPYVEFLFPTMVLLGIGFGLSFAALNVQATGGVENHEQGLASGLLNTSVQVGGAIVLAVVTAIVTSSSRTIQVHRQLLPGMTSALWVVVGISTVALVVTGARVAIQRRRPVAPAQIGLAVPGEAASAASDAVPCVACP